MSTSFSRYPPVTTPASNSASSDNKKASDMAVMAAPEEQARLLEDALGVVRQQTGMMRRCLETPGKLMDALKCWCVSPKCCTTPTRHINN